MSNLALRGLADIHVQAESYHLYAGPFDPASRGHWELKLDIAKPNLAKALGNDAADELVARFLGYLDRPDTLTYSTLFTVSCRKPA